MKKFIVIVLLLLIPVVSFAAKDYGDDDDRQTEQRDDRDRKKKDGGKDDHRRERGKDIDDHRRERGKDIEAPRLRPQPRVVAGSATAQPIIINNNNNNNNIVTTQQAQQQTTAVAVVAAPVAEPTPIVVRQARAPEPREPAAYVSSRGHWDEGAYFGLGFRIGASDMNQSDGAGYDKTYHPISGAFDISFGYKMPYVRVGGEMGFAGSKTEVDPAGSYRKEEDSFGAFTIMPHIFFDLDSPARVSPYVGFAGGLGIVSATYDLFWFDDSSSPDKTHTASAATFTYALMAGVHIGLVPAMELNVGYRFQDYGSVELLGYDNKMQSHELALGLTFKF